MQKQATRVMAKRCNPFLFSPKKGIPRLSSRAGETLQNALVIEAVS
ncbi:hypothetical protein [Desulfovibrio sp. An276]|nr:hypothetical protein [Desulfovibrio sp. An276]